MKKALIGIGMLALACFVCGPAMAVVPHVPVTSCANGNSPLTTPYGAPIGGTYLAITAAGSMPVFVLSPVPPATEPSPPDYIFPVDFWPAAGAWDFCAAFDTAACSLGALATFSTDVVTYRDLFFCGGADGKGIDINGPVNLDPPDGELPVSGNGIPDGQFELGLLAAIMNNTYALDPAVTGGKTNADVLNAFKSNFAFFQFLVTKALGNIPDLGDLRGLVPSVGPFLPTGLVTILTGYATEGDAQSVGALDTLLSLLIEIGLERPEGGVAGNTEGFASILGPEGDADGDGFTNVQEYNYFKAQGPATTVQAQLTASMVPPVGVVITGAGSGLLEEGSALTLTAVTLPGTTAYSYAWTKTGSATVLGTASQFVIPVVALTDAGKYTVTIAIDQATPATTVSAKDVEIRVVPEGQLPIAGGLGLALLAGACALGGVGSIRRRK